MKKKYFIIIIIFCFVMLVNISQVRAQDTDVSDREIAIASVLVEGQLEEGKTIAENFANSGGNILNYATKHELDDWLVIDYSNNLITELSLKAITIENNGNIIIAYKETDTEFLEDALCGLTNFHVQEIFANNYVDRIMEMYSKKEGNYKIYVTGHSLGGYIAQTSGARIAQRENEFDNVKLAKIVDFNSMGLNFIPILSVLRTKTVNTLKQLNEEGRLIDYSVFGDMVSAGGIHYGEIRNILPSIDSIVEHRENLQLFDSAQKIIRLTSILTKLLAANVDKARGLYQVDSMVAFFTLTHNTEEFVSLNYNEEDVTLKVTNSSENEIGDSLEISSTTTIRATTYGASAKTYKWYVSEDGVNWGEPVKVSSLYENSTVTIPTNTFDIEISDIKDGGTKYYKVESYYDDKYTTGTWKQSMLAYEYVKDEEQPQDYNSGMKEKIIKVTRNGGTESKISALKLTNILQNISKGRLYAKAIQFI